ncbi:etoposide-induced 2.4 [Artemisia annua]|uniref:Etoposide-induced 2.4 n=1 Tax=Artemisia annua TaxID=35608 RepID=A0A2U1PFK3_ARTAN|nr:etoposide-induced 2.4 [Artemisia annua]
MENNDNNIGLMMRRYLKQTSIVWLLGFREACCLHRVVIYCLRSKELMIRTGQCFLLNGFIFLGSIFILRSLIIPTLQWILPSGVVDGYEEQCSSEMPIRLYAFLRLGLLQLIYVLWFYPLYIFSFILSTIWYNDIAQFGLTVTGNGGPTNSSSYSQQEPSTSQNASHVDKPTNIGRVMIGIAEQGYSLLLLTFFFLEVYLTGFVPYIGKALNFLLLSWMYAYYCFEYKWNFSGLSLQKRLEFFESNWAFFAGFGSPCVLAIFFLSPLVSYGTMAVLFPLFVLTAAGSDADSIVNSLKEKWGSEELVGKLPIFYAADKLLMRILSLLPVEPRGQTSNKKAR